MGRSPGYSGPQAMSNGNYGHPPAVHYVPHAQYMMLPATTTGGRSEAIAQNVTPHDLQIKGFNPSQQNSMQEK